MSYIKYINEMQEVRELLDRVYAGYSKHGVSFENDKTLKENLNNFLEMYGMELVVRKSDCLPHYVARLVRVVDLNSTEQEAVAVVALEALRFVNQENVTNEHNGTKDG